MKRQCVRVGLLVAGLMSLAMVGNAFADRFIVGHTFDLPPHNVDLGPVGATLYFHPDAYYATGDDPASYSDRILICYGAEPPTVGAVVSPAITDGYDTFSLVLWLKALSSPDTYDRSLWTALDDMNYDDPGELRLWVEANTGKLCFSMMGAAGEYIVSSTTAVGSTSWKHIAVVYQQGTVSMYANGAPLSVTTSGTVVTSLPVLANREIYLGSAPDRARNWLGKLDEIAWLDHALTQPQIQAIKDNGLWAYRTILGPQVCGDPGTVYLSGDVSLNCYVDAQDVEQMAQDWLDTADVVPTFPDDLIVNGNFSDGMTGWNNYTLGSDLEKWRTPPLTATVRAPGLPDPALYWEHDGTAYAQAGVYQHIENVPMNIPVQIQWDWKGDTDSDDAGRYGWAEIRAYSWNRRDDIFGWSGTVLGDKSGENFAWDWTHGNVSFTPTTTDLVIILGGGTGAGPMWIAFDNISVMGLPRINQLIYTPEIPAITVDGNLSDWAEASTWADFGSWWLGGLASTSRARYAWNDSLNRLYIGIESTEGSALRLELGGLMGVPDEDPNALVKPIDGLAATQIDLKTWSGGTATSIVNKPGGTTSGIVVAYTLNGSTMTIEISMPIYSDWKNSGTQMNLTTGMDIYEYANVKNSAGTKGDSQVLDGHSTASLYTLPCVQVDSQLRLVDSLPPTCDDLPTALKNRRDIDKDCRVSLSDLSYISQTWLTCSDPGNDDCSMYW